MTKEDMLRKDIISSKLRLISKIQSSQKMDCSTLSLMTNTNSTAFWRTMCNLVGIKGHTREDLYQLIKNTVNEAFALIKKYHGSENSVDREICSSLLEDISAAKSNLLTGIKQLYHFDDAFISKLEQLDKHIAVLLHHINNPDIMTSEMLNSKLSV